MPCGWPCEPFLGTLECIHAFPFVFKHAFVDFFALCGFVLGGKASTKGKERVEE